MKTPPDWLMQSLEKLVGQFAVFFLSVLLLWLTSRDESEEIRRPREESQWFTRVNLDEEGKT